MSARAWDRQAQTQELGIALIRDSAAMMRVANRFNLERQTEKSVKQIGGTAATAGGRGRVLLHEEATKQARTATKWEGSNGCASRVA